MKTITIEYEDGSEAMITEQEFIEACLETLKQMKRNKRRATALIEAWAALPGGRDEVL